MTARLTILKAAAREHLTYDLGPLAPPAAYTAYAAARALIVSPSRSRQAQGFSMLTRLHSAAWAPSVDHRILDDIKRADTAERAGRPTGLWRLYDQTIDHAARSFSVGAKPDPRRLLGSRILVVKAARPNERGVLIVDYSYVFASLPGLFDLPAIADRYTIVLEPSWAGTCTPEILLYTRLGHPVFVETVEPRDHDLLTRLDTNLRAVPIAANFWADHRRAPAPSGQRDIDVVMVAAWADIKRHWRVLRTLGRLRRRGHRLKVAFVGYPYDRTREDIESLASHFGVRDQIETYERISQDTVFALLCRSKIHVLWSRRECANRAIIEAMLADVPVIVRQGMTFGFPYPYINEHTGRFVPEGALGDALLEMIDARSRYSPRAWVLAHMTSEHASTILEEHLRAAAEANGESWSEGLVGKVSALDSQQYVDPRARERFRADYAFLESTIRSATLSGPPAQEYDEALRGHR